MRLAIDTKEATKEEYGFVSERITAIEVDTDELTGLTDDNFSILTIEIENNLKRKIIIEKSELKIFAEFIIERLKNC